MADISATHPFEIESVVDNIFKYLQLNETIKHRIVSKLWHKIGTKRLVDRIDECTIQFGTNWSFEVSDPRKTVDNFLQMQENSSIKFTNFATYYFESDLNGKIPKAQETTKLFRQYGRHMKQVKLDLSGKNCWTFLSSVLMTLAPNVEKLHLDGYPSEKVIDKKLFPLKKPELKLKSLILHSQDEYEDPIYSREFLTDLFESSAHLEVLVIGLDEDQIQHDRVVGHESLILAILASKGNISNLIQLSLNGTEDVFEVLAESYKRAPLRKFHTSITQIDSIEMLENIETLLEDHKDTWTELVFTFPWVDECMNEINFPKMVNLTYLSINEWCIDEEELDESIAPIRILDFGRHFPNLVTLKLTEDPKTNGRTFFTLEESFTQQAAPVLSLKNLSLPPLFHAFVLRRIGRIFPNVINLDLTVRTVEVLKELWDIWPEMKQLDITIVPGVSFRSTSLDSIFTGIPNESLKKLQDCRANPVAVKSFPYIGRLKKLTKLIIRGPSRSGSHKVNKSFDVGVKVTNVSARLALANLKELSFLRISSGRHEISPSCVQELCNGLGLQRVEDGGALRLVKYEFQKEIRVYDW